VRNTLAATQAIATIAQQTDAKAAITRKQVEAMGNISRTLLEMVAFFQVQTEGVSEAQADQPSVEPVIDVTPVADSQLVSA
jgi:hypothetical protein